MRRSRFARTVLLALFACRTPKPLLVESVPAAEGQAGASSGASTLGTGDLLEVRVFDEPDLSGAYRVSPEGTLDFPLCGKVPVNGLTTSGASDILTKCLANGYLKHPNVT